MKNKPIVFMFSGQGSHYFQMGKELFQHHPGFKKWMMDLNEIVYDNLGESILDKLYEQKKSKHDLFDKTVYTHPAIFMVEYALAQVLLESEIRPDYVFGTSMGEFAAAAVAGVMNFEEALLALIKQAQLLEKHCQAGGMLAILHKPTLFKDIPLLFNNSELASYNFDSHFVISGQHDALKEIASFLKKQHIAYQSLPVSQAFHSALIEPAASYYIDFLRKKKLKSPEIPFISCTQVDIIPSLSQNYFWDVVRKPMAFQQTVQMLEKKQPFLYLDLGPSGTLANFVKYNLTKSSKSEIVPIMTIFGNSLKNLEKLKKNINRNKMITYVFPGQGSQVKGMGDSLFDEFSDLTAQADEILGYSIKELCLEDPRQQLNQTQYTQPALYVVNALSFLKKGGKKPDFVAGHSLGEYNALLASGGIDFATGLKLVKKRGELMSQASNGAMAAVLNVSADKIKKILTDNHLTGIDIANYNAPSQIVITGLKEDIKRSAEVFGGMAVRCLVLNVSAAFHSRYMRPAQEEFENFLKTVEFSQLSIPIIGNVHAKPYKQTEIANNLAKQITHSVNWVDSIRYLMGQGEMIFEEIGPGNVLTKLFTKIKKESKPLMPIKEKGDVSITPDSLGSQEFKQAYHLKYAYVTGAMAKGIASKELVVKIAKAGMMGFFGTGGLNLSKVAETIQFIQRELNAEQSYGMNLLHNPSNPSLEEETVDLFLKMGVKNIEAAAFMQITPALVRYRLKGHDNKIMAKVSRPEIAQAFLSPAPERIIKKLLDSNKISQAEAALAKTMPMADDICVEADSGGHTDMGIISVLLPTIIRQRNELAPKVRIGAAGGIGTPEAAATAFILGADFILTGSINQCTVEADTSDAVKEILQHLNVQDTDYAPAGDMFEIGAKVQVVRKGVFFPARANKLYELYRHYNSLDEIDDKTKRQIQEKYFRRSFEDVYAETKAYYSQNLPEEIEKAERNPKHKMALIFKWYFVHSMRLARDASEEQKVDYQIHSGPAMGAFNQWVKGTNLENWRNRQVDKIAEKMMRDTASFLNERFQSLGDS